MLLCYFVVSFSPPCSSVYTPRAYLFLPPRRLFKRPSTAVPSCLCARALRGRRERQRGLLGGGAKGKGRTEAAAEGSRGRVVTVMQAENEVSEGGGGAA